MKKEDLFKKFEKENPDFPKYILEDSKNYIPNSASVSDVEKILENLKKEYEELQIECYESIGVITAQSIGEPATQMTLNTFHFAGVSSHSVEGLPRLIEILEMRSNITSPIMKLHLRNKRATEEDYKILAEKIRETTLEHFSKEIDIDLENKFIELVLNLKKLKECGIEVENVISSLDLRLRKVSSIIDGKMLRVKASPSSDLKALIRLKSVVTNSVIYGIKGIKDISIIKEDNELVLITHGSSIKKILEIDEIDKNRIYSNNICEIYNVFGIEAVRQAIIVELLEVIGSQGLKINERHTMLIADLMCYIGEARGMTRFGIMVDKQNVLSRASFETPIKHLSNAAIQSEKNELTSITENVILNQIINVGTGIPKIIIKENKKNK